MRRYGGDWGGGCPFCDGPPVLIEVEKESLGGSGLPCAIDVNRFLSLLARRGHHQHPTVSDRLDTDLTGDPLC